MTTPPPHLGGGAMGAEDYTRRIRYPNNSKIHVQPLHLQDHTLKGAGQAVGGVLRAGGDAAPLEKVFRAGDPQKIRGSRVPAEPFFCDRSKFDFYQRQPLAPANMHMRGMSVQIPIEDTHSVPCREAVLSSEVRNVYVDAMGKGPRGVSLVERLSSFQRSEMY